MIEKYWIGLIVIATLLVAVFLFYRHLSKPTAHSNSLAMDKSIDDMKTNSLLEGFFTGIFCKYEADKFKEIQNIDSFKQAYTEQLVALDLSEQEIEKLITVFANEMYLPGIEAGFTAKALMEGDEKLENLDFTDGDTVITTVDIIVEWFDDNKKDSRNYQNIIKYLPTCFVEKFSEIV